MNMKTEQLNYECEVLDPAPTFRDWWKNFSFHGDNLALATDHVRHFMNHQGVTKARFRKLGTTLWREISTSAAQSAIQSGAGGGN